jgi:hypothetical protein
MTLFSRPSVPNFRYFAAPLGFSFRAVSNFYPSRSCSTSAPLPGPCGKWPPPTVRSVPGNWVRGVEVSERPWASFPPRTVKRRRKATTVRMQNTLTGQSSEGRGKGSLAEHAYGQELGYSCTASCLLVSGSEIFCPTIRNGRCTLSERERRKILHTPTDGWTELENPTGRIPTKAGHRQLLITAVWCQVSCYIQILVWLVPCRWDPVVSKLVQGGRPTKTKSNSLAVSRGKNRIPSCFWPAW